jgi:N-acetylmuramoyl-L-alanine amidase
LLESLHRINSLEKPEVQQAGFMVLKSPDIPSVLVETAFISNPHEERMLRDPADQERFATSIFDGIRGYFSRYRPLQTVAAADGARKNLQARSAGKGKTIPVSLTKADGDDRAAQRTSAND